MDQWQNQCIRFGRKIEGFVCDAFYEMDRDADDAGYELKRKNWLFCLFVCLLKFEIEIEIQQKPQKTHP